MIKYLSGLMIEKERKVNSFIISEPYSLGQPISKYPFLKIVKKELFKDIKYIKSKNGRNINTKLRFLKI